MNTPWRARRILVLEASVCCVRRCAKRAISEYKNHGDKTPHCRQCDRANFRIILDVVIRGSAQRRHQRTAAYGYSYTLNLANKIQSKLQEADRKAHLLITRQGIAGWRPRALRIE